MSFYHGVHAGSQLRTLPWCQAGAGNAELSAGFLARIQFCDWMDLLAAPDVWQTWPSGASSAYLSQRSDAMRGPQPIPAEDTVTEVPDFLLERSRSRRVALGLLDDDGAAAAGGGDTGGGGVAAAASGPTTADLVAAAKAAAKLETQPEPEADPVWVEAAKSRNKIPMWVLPIVFFLPLWAFVYVKLTEEPPEAISALNEGATVYATSCAACHVGDGSGTSGGGIGRPLFNGEVLLTFPELDESMISWLDTGTAGIGNGNVYGDPNRAGGAHIAGELGGAMPGFTDSLNEHQIYSVARYIRESLSGEQLTEAEVATRDAEWQALGGGADTGGGGGGH